jgi:hypothetical protein
VTAVEAGVRKRLTCHRNKLPIVAGYLEGKFENAVGIGVANLAIWLDRLEWAKVSTTGAYDERPH